MVFHLPGGGQLSVVDLLVFDWGDIVQVAVKPFGVVPVHPSQGGELDLVEGSPRPLVGSPDEFGLVQATSNRLEVGDGKRR